MGRPFVSELDARFPGVTQIVETWFANYKGPRVVATEGFGDADEVEAMLELAEGSYATH